MFEKAISPVNSWRLLLAAIMIAGSGCGGSVLVSSWRDPIPPPTHLRNVLVISPRNDGMRQRIWEDALVAEATKRGLKATPSYRLFPTGKNDPETFRQALAGSEFDGIILVHYVSSTIDSTYVPSTVTKEAVRRWDPFYHRYETVYDEVTSAAYTETETVVTHDGAVYGGDAGTKILWQGKTTTSKPGGTEKVSADVAKIMIEDMVKGGLF